MYIKELALRNFRNYESISVDFSPGINFIAGPNAAGKTNILEAVSVISNLRSFRNVPDSEIIKWGDNTYFCSLVLGDSACEKFEIGCSFQFDKIQKKAKIDGLIKKRISDYYGKFLTVIFSPEDLSITSGPPDIRRKYFDAVISKVDIEYLENLNDFKRILAARNKLLRDIREKKKNRSADLEIWDNMFAQRASIILKKRIEFILMFNESFKASGARISENEDSPYIEYDSTFSSNNNNGIIDELLKRRDKDIFLASTGLGPHRDDYVIFYKDRKVFKNSASQGQKRTAAVSLKIAECEFLEREAKQRPVILIDDIFGELDEKRRNKMMDIINDRNQVIITAVNQDSIQIEDYSCVQRFYVLPGGIVERL
ncbi:MAG: DNA replication and repair protein RecF [Spirochaetes bacterium]|nr:DNA replication and repair protein RecF [Spirochaetota bacterium]